jgi:tetratricopeptide (TPR) repeat protein
LLTALVDKSLLTWHPTGRYVLHALVRQYAAEQLHAAGEAAETHARHLQYYQALADAAESKMNGPEQTLWLDRLEAETDNLRAALAWSLGAGENEGSLLLAVALYPFWYWRNHFHEGRNWLARALAQVTQVQPLSTPRQARALWAAGVLSELQSDYTQAAQFYEESLTLRRILKDQAGLAASLNSLGALRYRQQAYDQAQALFEESLALRRGLGQTSTLGIPLNNLGLTALAKGDYARASDHFAQCLTLARAAGDKGGMATVLNNLGTAMLAQREPRRALVYFAECLVLQQELLDKDGLAGCLEGMAVAGLMLEPGEESATWAAHLLGAAEALRAEVGAPILQVMRPLYEDAVALLHAILDQAAFTAAWSAGRALSIEAAIGWAQKGGKGQVGDLGD